MPVTPYLFFEGRAEEAAEFYRKALGAEVQALMRFGEVPAGGAQSEQGCGPAPGSPDKVMHMELKIGDTTIMGSDGMCSGKPSFQGFSLTLSPKTKAEAEKLFKELGEGGQVQMPLAETFFASRFGMVADRFGLSWMVVVDKEMAAAA